MPTQIDALVQYGLDRQLLFPEDRIYAFNCLLQLLKLDEDTTPAVPSAQPLSLLLEQLTQDAVTRGVCADNSAARELLDTALMGVLTPAPHEVQQQFSRLYAQSPQAATEFYYRFSQDTNYIRRDRIARDLHWQTDTEYGALDITINLSKPEKDPSAIAAAKAAPTSGYPKCLLCPENEGYAGRMNHPARNNHRLIPILLDSESWFLQYSPYVYYNEHCIVLNSRHVPMVIDGSVFRKLLDFVTYFPHYFVGSNADLPIVGGSILSHEHFQGGHYTFAMERAPVETPVAFPGFSDLRCGIVRWPMSVLRLTGPDRTRLAALAERILNVWRRYSDEAAFVFAFTDGEPHNTITPIARRRGGDYELDLVLRNNLTTPEHPLGVFHPHAELHHIKKENIGLIEVMGLAVLPARLKQELSALETAILSGQSLTDDPLLSPHAAWAHALMETYTFDRENISGILQKEVGLVFRQVLEHAGVYKRTPEGQAAFLRFIRTVQEEKV